jgi:hypothetical protein
MAWADPPANAKTVIANIKITINARIFSGMQFCNGVLTSCSVFHTMTCQGSTQIFYAGLTLK